MAKTLEYDVVCVGAGGAGITAAVTAARQGARVLLISKDPLGYGSTRIAVGLIASRTSSAALFPPNSRRC